MPPPSELYPLRFEPVFRQYIWGGRRLETVLGKPIGQGHDYAESWEVVDHGDDQSVVAFGPLAGMTLKQIVKQCGQELLGLHAPLSQFPLLFKLLDCNRNLSVQVHPNDEQGARLDPPDLGKTEAWVILDARPRSIIYAGLKPGVDQSTLAAAIDQGQTESCLHQIEPQAGDCVFIPAGTVHALGEGLLVAEIQQASDTTFRLFDWNRVGADGQPRPLHIGPSLAVIDYERGPVDLQRPHTIEAASDAMFRQRLVECDKFVLDRCKLAGEAAIGGDDRFHIVCVLSGEVTIANDPAGKSMTIGQTALLPASAGRAAMQPSSEATLLDMYLP